MKEIRCPFCKQLLLKVEFCRGEIKCIRCKKIIYINEKDRASNTVKNN